MTNQEAFDKMMNHLRNLKDRSVNADGHCVYNGSKCAIGALMTDEEQERWGDYRNAVSGLLEVMRCKGHKSLLHDLNLELLDLMQRLHDNEFYWNDDGSFNNEERAKEIAKGFNLTYTGA